LSVFDVADKRKEYDELEAMSQMPGFWEDALNGQRVMREMSVLREEFEKYDTPLLRIADAIELASLGDNSIAPELDSEYATLAETLSKLEFSMLFSGEFDRENAILALHAGTGGVDAMDWAKMLERMFLRWAESHAFKVEILDRSEAEQGLKSVVLGISGRWAYGYLRSERGVHRLVRLSPFDSAHRRHTSFALVEIWPDIHENIEIDINPSDLVIETYKSSGAGGQNVQKNETAIRITHLPTGVVVTCQNERSLTQNRESAMRVLRARMFELERQKQEKEKNQLKGEHVDANFGNQIRSYVLHPYQMVKDHRTDLEISNTNSVLDGNLDAFMEAFLEKTAKSVSPLSPIDVG
jgi:peptide chain release factor 2